MMTRTSEELKKSFPTMLPFTEGRFEIGLFDDVDYMEQICPISMPHMVTSFDII